jgi:hypothetical protein
MKSNHVGDFYVTTAYVSSMSGCHNIMWSAPFELSLDGADPRASQVIVEPK